MPQSMMDLESETPPKSQDSSKKKHRKWTFGGLFRRKKNKGTSSESSDSDEVHNNKKGGFLMRRQRRRAANRGSKDVTGSFEHVVMRPSGGSTGNLSDGKKSLKARVEANRDKLRCESSSEEDSPRIPRSHRSSKRLSKDMSDCPSMKVLELDSSPRSPRWTAKIVYCESSDYEARYTAKTRSATPSPAQSPITKRAATSKVNSRPPKPQPPAPRPFIDQKSASFDLLPRPTNHHARVPPPPPPRDPQRKILPPLGYSMSYDRPLSYAFESDQPLPKLMMDHNSNITPYKVHSSSSLENRRAYQYYTDQQPRSRRPIHIARTDQHSYLSDSQIGRSRSHYGSSDWRIPRESNSSLYDSSDSREGPEARQLSMVLEAQEQVQNKEMVPKIYQIPKQNPHHYENKQQNSFHKRDFSLLQQPQQQTPEKLKDNKSNSSHQHRKSNNLEDALDELEAIYKSLQLNDEDPPNSRGFESDSGCYRYIDDMAYRRLNRRDSNGSPDSRRIASQAGSYLLVSPALSPPPFANAPPIIPTPDNEPDITLDDVVYRSIRHAKNTLKISDPQPPFGIPLGPVAPAANSDYLHASPKEIYRPTFKPRKTPDVVKDDLAYRNLRKDKNFDSLLSAENQLVNDTSIKKKRAARSLSANLLSIIQKENMCLEDKLNSYNSQSDMEKTRSYSDLPDVLNCRYKVNRNYTDDSDVTPRVSRQYYDFPLSTTSTETLTDGKNDLITQDYCSNQENSVRLPTNKLLPKTDATKNRLPSPSCRTSSPSPHRTSTTSPHRTPTPSPHRTSIPSPQRTSIPSPQRTSPSSNRKSYSTDGKIKFPTPTSVNLEKYMQRYNDNNLSSYSNPTSCLRQQADSTQSNQNRDKMTCVVNNTSKEDIVSSSSQKSSSPLYSPSHEYYKRHSTQNQVIDVSDFPPSIISVNTNKYLKDTRQPKSDTSDNILAHSNGQDLSYLSSPLIYVRKSISDKPNSTEENKRPTEKSSLTPTTSSVHNIVDNYNRLITNSSSPKRHVNSGGDNMPVSNESHEAQMQTKSAIRSIVNDNYTQNMQSTPKFTKPSSPKDCHSHSLKIPLTNIKSILKSEGGNNCNEYLSQNKRELPRASVSPCFSKTNENKSNASEKIETVKNLKGSNENSIVQNGTHNTQYFSSPHINASTISNITTPGGFTGNQSSIKNQLSDVECYQSILTFTPNKSDNKILKEASNSDRSTTPHNQGTKTVVSSKNNDYSKNDFEQNLKTTETSPENLHLKKSNEQIIMSSIKNSHSHSIVDDIKLTHPTTSGSAKLIDIVKSEAIEANCVTKHTIMKTHSKPEDSTCKNKTEILETNTVGKIVTSFPKTEVAECLKQNNCKEGKSLQIAQSDEQERPLNLCNISETTSVISSHLHSSPEKVFCYSKPPVTAQSYLQSDWIQNEKIQSNNQKITGNINKSSAEIPKTVTDYKSSLLEVQSIPKSSSHIKPSNKSLIPTEAVGIDSEDSQQPDTTPIVTEEAKMNESLDEDLNKLLSEINTKQKRLLSDTSTLVPSQISQERKASPSPLIEKKDSIIIGKIVQHKPVKLNAFSIDKEVTNNNEADSSSEDICGSNIVKSSESMTDLLRELTRSLDQDFGKEEAHQSTDNTILNSNNTTSEELLSVVESNSVHSDVSDSRDCSEICDILRNVDEVTEAEKSLNSSTSRNTDLSKNGHSLISQDREQIENRVDCLDCPSDDSNTEFVEQICKTASELSTLSCAVNNERTSNNHSSPAPADRVQACRQSSQADRNEGIVTPCSRSSMLKPLVNSSGLLMLTTHCMADLHQMVDLDFLTMLGLLIAILSLLWLLIS